MCDCDCELSKYERWKRLEEDAQRSAADLIRAHTDADYRHVVSAYGWAYANGWRAGRERAAELIEGGEIE